MGRANRVWVSNILIIFRIYLIKEYFKILYSNPTMLNYEPNHTGNYFIENYLLLFSCYLYYKELFFSIYTRSKDLIGID